MGNAILVLCVLVCVCLCVGGPEDRTGAADEGAAWG